MFDLHRCLGGPSNEAEFSSSNFLSKGRFASGLRPGMETCSPPLYPVGWNLRRFLAICLNSALCQDQFRVKYGPLVSPTLLFCSRAGPRWAASRAPFWCSSTGNSGIAETNYRSGPWLLSPPSGCLAAEPTAVWRCLLVGNRSPSFAIS